MTDEVKFNATSGKYSKLNYHQSNINWGSFGTRVENLCKHLGLDYYIKESLRAEMVGGIDG